MMKMIAPIVIGSVPASVSGSNDNGIAVKIIDTMIRIIGIYASKVSTMPFPGTRNGLSVFGSVLRSFKNAGNTGMYDIRNITRFSAKKLQNRS